MCNEKAPVALTRGRARAMSSIVGEDAPATATESADSPALHVTKRKIPGEAALSRMPGEAPLNQWPESERPRERLLQHGAQALSNAELLAILLRTGARGQSAVAMAMQLLAEHDRSLSRLLSSPPARLMRRHGLGPARATTLAVVTELARRAVCEQLTQTSVLDSPAAVRDYLALSLRGESREVFLALFVNSQHRLIQADVLFTGTLNQTAVYPREVLRRAIELNAAALILAHNHPSGHPEPSAADRTLTLTLKEVLAQVDIRVLDHIIVAAEQQYSFARHGLL